MRCMSILAFLVFTVITLPSFGQDQADSTGTKLVYVFDIKGDIDPRMNRRVKLALEEAGQKEADMIVIHMVTYGGAVYDADDIRTMILVSTIPTHAIIDKVDVSAGALIVIPSVSIYMTNGVNIYAATIVL